MLKKHNTMIRRTVDVCMTALLLCLMAYQVTGETLHEWIGIGMTVLVILHQILNRKWYGAMFKGKYKSYRIISSSKSPLHLLITRNPASLFFWKISCSLHFGDISGQRPLYCAGIHRGRKRSLRQKQIRQRCRTDLFWLEAGHFSWEVPSRRTGESMMRCSMK